jgi:hypothetical protein
VRDYVFVDLGFGRIAFHHTLFLASCLTAGFGVFFSLYLLCFCQINPRFVTVFA